MSTTVIHCPNCKSSIDISEALSALASQDFQEKLEQQKAALKLENEKEKEAINAQSRQWKEEQKQLQQQEKRELEARLKKEADENFARMQAGMKQQTEELIASLQKQQEENFKREKQALEQQLATAKAKEQEALDLKIQLEEFRRETQAKERQAAYEFQQSLLEKERESALKSDALINEKLEKMRKELEDANKLKTELAVQEEQKHVRELEQKIQQMRNVAYQSNVQVQGEANEQYIENLLKSNFPQATISAIKTGGGRKGADIRFKYHDFATNTGLQIEIECKEAQSFDPKWISKLKEDGAESGADILVIITKAMPKGKEQDAMVLEEGVYVINSSNPTFILGSFVPLVSEGLRFKRQVGIQSNSKDNMELLYNYLMSDDFKSRFNGILEFFANRRRQHDAEKLFFKKKWSAEEKELNAILDSAQTVYHNIQSIAISNDEPFNIEAEGEAAFGLLD